MWSLSARLYQYLPPTTQLLSSIVTYKIPYSGIYVDIYLNLCNPLTKYSSDCTRYKPCPPPLIPIHSCPAFCDLLINTLYTDPERDAKSVFVSFYSSLMTIRVEVNGRITTELFVLAWIGVHA